MAMGNFRHRMCHCRKRLCIHPRHHFRDIDGDRERCRRLTRFYVESISDFPIDIPHLGACCRPHPPENEPLPTTAGSFPGLCLPMSNRLILPVSDSFSGCFCLRLFLRLFFVFHAQGAQSLAGQEAGQCCLFLVCIRAGQMLLL